MIDEVWIHRDSLQAYIICIAVPNEIILKKVAADLGIQGEFKELCDNWLVKEAVLKDLWDIGKAANLLSLEQAKKIYLEPVIYYNLFIRFHLYNMIY